LVLKKLSISHIRKSSIKCSEVTDFLLKRSQFARVTRINSESKQDVRLSTAYQAAG